MHFIFNVSLKTDKYFNANAKKWKKFFLILHLKCILSCEKQYVSPLNWLMQKIFWWSISLNGENSLDSQFLICITDNSYNQNQEIQLCHWVELENYFHPHLSSLVNILQKSYSEFRDTHNFKVTKTPNFISGARSLTVIELEG